MALPINEIHNYGKARGKEIGRRIHLIPFSDDLNLASKATYSLDFSMQATQIIPTVRTSHRDTQLAEGFEAVGYASSLRKLVKSSGVYALSSLAAPLVALVLAPFLTRNLSYSDYGALAVLSTALVLLAGLTQLGLNSAFFRSYSYDYETQKDRLGVVSTVVVLLSVTSVCIAIATVIAAPWLTTLLLNSSSLSNAVRLVGLVVLLQNLTVPGFAWLRAENRAIIFSTLSIVNLLVTLGATLIFVGILHMGVAGSLLATGSGYAIVAICTLPIILLRAGVRPRLDIAPGLLSFGLPNVSSFLSIWVLQLSDRFMLVHLGSLAQTASYSLAYSLGGVLGVVVLAPFTLAWPAAMFTIAKRDDATNIFRVVFRWYFLVLLFATSGLSFMSIIVLNLFFPPAYHAAAPIIPIIALSIMFYGIYNMFMTGVSIKRKTWYAVIFTTTAALLNIGLNVVLIPLFGSMGAALSTLLAYTLLTLIAYSMNQKIYPIPYEIGIFLLALSIGIALLLGIYSLTHFQGTYKLWSIYLGAVVLYGSCLVCLGKLPVRNDKPEYQHIEVKSLS